MTEHTPTPWGMTPRERHAPTPRWMIHPGNEYESENRIAVVSLNGAPGGDENIAEANAAFIMRAVNNHEALVEALTKIANARGINGHTATRMKELARAALEKATT